MTKYGSKKQMEKEGPQFKPLKSGAYIAMIHKLEVRDKKNYSGNIVPTLSLQFIPYEANARKAQMENMDGATVRPLGQKLFMDFDRFSMGFRENFTIPSRFRSLLAAVQGVDPNSELDGPEELSAQSVLEYFKAYEGKYITVNVTVVEKNEKQRNKITDFLAAPEDFESDKTIEAEFFTKEKERANRKDDDNAPRGSSTEVEEEEIEEEDAPAKSDDKKKIDTKKALF